MSGGVETLAGRLAGPIERRAAIFMASLLVLVAAVAYPFAPVPLPPVVPFLPMFGMLATTSDVLTVFLLISQARVSRSNALLALAVAYAFSGAAVAAHVAVFPGVFTPDGLFGAGRQTMMWLWVFWHAVFPLWIIGYAVYASRALTTQAVEVSLKLAGALLALVVVIVSAVTYGCIVSEPLLPTLIRASTPGLFGQTHIGYVVIGLIAAALGTLIYLTRLRNVVDLWLAVALLASLLDTTLTNASADRYTVGWYVSRGMSLSTSMVVLIAFLIALGSMFSKLARMSRMDGLTGLANRRSFDESLTLQVALARRTGHPISVVMLDVDHFKAYNDTYGHPAGDVALRAVARALHAVIGRKSDFAARYGGEEFIAILPATDSEGARRVAQRICNHVRHLNLKHEKSPHGIVTVSIGISTLSAGTNKGNFTPMELLRRADEALYKAKSAGRDTAIAYRDGTVASAPPASSAPGAAAVEEFDVEFNEAVVEFELPELQPHIA